MNHQQTPSQLRAVNREDRTVDIVASTFDIDSYGTRIDPNGWQLDAYKRNPVICVQHDSYSSRGLPVAVAIPETIRVENNKLVMRVRFASEGISEVADTVFGLVADGIISGVSVGFNPVEWEDVEETVDGYKKQIRVYRKQSLMEVSFVTIPSNDQALVQRSASQNADPEEVKLRTVKLEEGILKELGKETEEQRKHREYFEKKQPANRAATKFLEKFAKRHDIELSGLAEEKAWERAAEEIEEKPLEIDQPEAQPEEKGEEAAAIEAPKEEGQPQELSAPAEETAAEETQEPSTTPAEEAPLPARTAFVQIPLQDLSRLLRNVRDVCVEAAVEASRNGVPQRELGGVIDAVAAQAHASLSHSS